VDPVVLTYWNALVKRAGRWERIVLRCIRVKVAMLVRLHNSQECGPWILLLIIACACLTATIWVLAKLFYLWMSMDWRK
jgi:hypothetical protein